jgi:putative tricarboxylic transport membrane protein
MATWTRWRDVWAGLLIAGIGVGAAFIGRGYGIGTLTHMGPGFFPVALGVLLTGIGLIMAAGRLFFARQDEDEVEFARPDWRGWICIVLGVVSFIALAESTGLIAATFACVFISALGDRTNTLREASLLAAGITVFAVAVFSYALQLPLPLFRLASL